MRSKFMIVAEVCFENASQMFVVDDDHVIQALAPDAAVLWGFPLCGVRSDNPQLELLAPARPPHN